MDNVHQDLSLKCGVLERTRSTHRSLCKPLCTTLHFLWLTS